MSNKIPDNYVIRKIREDYMDVGIELVNDEQGTVPTISKFEYDGYVWHRGNLQAMSVQDAQRFSEVRTYTRYIPIKEHLKNYLDDLCTNSDLLPQT